MSESKNESPALRAAQKAEAEVSKCLEQKTSFLLEAGAGAGKTFSLVEALRKVIAEDGRKLRRNNQQIACITYTNAAVSIIAARIDGNELATVSTIHAFWWSVLKTFQPILRREIQNLQQWQERLADGPLIALQTVEYDQGFRNLTDEIISLHHDDVIALAAKFLSFPKFQAIVGSRYPYLFIDEYQDTEAGLMSAIKANLFDRKEGPTIGLFGDHWQRIYDDTCGHVTGLKEIGKGANFRSATNIVSVLNKIRPELPQAVKDEHFAGSAIVFHTNSWRGTRLAPGRGGHWKGDLPTEEAHNFLTTCVETLKRSGWDFAPEKTKVLLLTHNGLAAEQGYSQLAKVFRFTDSYIKKTDPHVAYFADKLEPAAGAYSSRRFAAMFESLGEAAPRLSSTDDKKKWSGAMEELIRTRENGRIGDVIDCLLRTGYPRLPENVARREKEAREWQATGGTEPPEGVVTVKNLRAIPYSEIIALVKYLDGHTPFTTKHSVKGDQFENVLVVLGRGWNKYDFDQYLQWAANPSGIEGEKVSAYERNRNLFYVCCSRSIARLALLFTQILSVESLTVLQSWFGRDRVIDVGEGHFPQLTDSH